MLLQELFDNTPADKKHKDAAIAALKRRLSSKGDKESVASAAYEVGRAYGIPARELARMYSQVHEAKISQNMKAQFRALQKVKKALPKKDKD